MIILLVSINFGHFILVGNLKKQTSHLKTLKEQIFQAKHLVKCSDFDLAASAGSGWIQSGQVRPSLGRTKSEPLLCLICCAHNVINQSSQG